MTDAVTVAALAGLPPAEVIEEISHAAIVADMVADFAVRWEELRADAPDLPSIDTLDLESEPVRKVFEAAAYREMVLRARINDAARANLLYYAQGTDLQHLALFYDVLKMLGESDEALKSRIILAIQGRSPGGPEERYKAIARAADVRVADVAVYRIGRDPTIRVAIWASDNGGVADATLLATVDAALQAKGVRLVNDVIVVGTAAFQTVDVAVDVWLLPTASETILDTLPGILREAWAAEGVMGFDLEREWIQARLMVAGVRKVVATSAGVVAEPYQALSLGSITPAYKGRYL